MFTPIKDQWIVVDGGRMRYQVCGTGPPLLLLHGLLGYLFSWRNAIPAFSTKATVYAVDMLGAGFSEFPPSLDCTVRGSAARLLRFMGAIGIDSCDVLASSHGGAIAMMAAALAPGKIKRLVLVAPVNPWSQFRGRLIRLLKNPAVALLFVSALRHLKFTHEYILHRLFGDPKRIAPGTLEGYSAPYARAGSFAYGLQVVRSWNRDMHDLKSVLPEIVKIPTLLIWGDRDRAVDPASATILCQNFQCCRLVVFPGVGHIPYEEVPEEFHRVVLEFLCDTDHSATAR